MNWSSFGRFFHVIAGGNPGKTPARPGSQKGTKENDPRRIRQETLSQPPKRGAKFPKIQGR